MVGSSTGGANEIRLIQDSTCNLYMQYLVGNCSNGYATHRYGDFAKHGYTPADVRQGNVLGSRNNHRTYEKTSSHLKTPTQLRAHIPSTTTSWPSVSCTSPVPGGISTTSTSSPGPSPPSRQSTSNNSWAGVTGKALLMKYVDWLGRTINSLRTNEFSCRTAKTVENARRRSPSRCELLQFTASMSLLRLNLPCTHGKIVGNTTESIDVIDSSASSLKKGKPYIGFI